MQTPQEAREEGERGVRDKGMERVGRRKCDGGGVGEMQKENGDDNKHVEGKRWDGGSRIIEKKRREMEKR